MEGVVQHAQVDVEAVALEIVEVSAMAHALDLADMVVLEVAEEGLCLWFIRNVLLN